MLKLYYYTVYFLLVGVLWSCYQKSTFEIAYVFEKIKDIKSISVELTFRGNANGNSTIILPNECAGQEKLYNAISELKTNSSTH
jgi:hypothetical protein